MHNKGRFIGFPRGSSYTPIPDALFGFLLEEFKELSTLKTVLRVVYLLHCKKGSPRLLTQGEMEADPLLQRTFVGDRRAQWGVSELDDAVYRQAVQEGISLALDDAVYQGILLRTKVGPIGLSQPAYILNSEVERNALAGINRDNVEVMAISSGEMVQPVSPSDIFTLYEDHIGMLTPLIAEELKDAEQQYPLGWIRAAFLEAVENNKRSWRYTARILERWREDGRGHGEPRRHSAKSDPKAYIRGWRRSSSE